MPIWISKKKITLRDIIVKLLKRKGKEKNFKSKQIKMNKLPEGKQQLKL